jgi:hypothetical protein
MPDFGPDELLVLDLKDDGPVDRRDDRSTFVSLAGRYSLADSTKTQSEPRQFACRVVNISTSEMALAAPVAGKRGVRVIADIEQLGRLTGPIIRVFKLGFAMSIEANDQERDVLSSKIDWIERNKDFEIADNRTHGRFIPRRPHSLLILADGSVIPCFVIDISVSGAGVSADIMPKIGTVLAVGKVVGRVVRHFSGGFAVHFAEMQDRKEVEALVIRK